MNDENTDEVTRSQRIVYVVARDILSLERRDVGLEDFIKPVWRGRWLIITCILIFGLAGITYAFVARKWYVATTVLMPVSENNMHGLAGQLGNLGLLTSLAGINLNTGNSAAASLGVLRSRDFAREFIEQQNLLHVLLWNQWNAKAGRWRESNPLRQPDIRDAIRYFDRDVLAVTQDRESGLVTVSIRWKDPVKAAAWANMVVERLNAEMRARALAEGDANIAFLEKEMATTTQMSVRAAVAQVIETELQKLMLARSNKQFAFRIIDHAQVPKYRAWPKRGIIAVIGVFAGGLGGLFAVFTREVMKRRSHRGRKGKGMQAMGRR